MKSKVKLFFEATDKESKIALLEFQVEGIRNVQKDYINGAIAYNACAEKIKQKRSEIDQLKKSR